MNIDVVSDVSVVENKSAAAFTQKYICRRFGVAGTSHVKNGSTACESEAAWARASVSVLTLLVNSYNE